MGLQKGIPVCEDLSAAIKTIVHEIKISGVAEITGRTQSRVYAWMSGGAIGADTLRTLWPYVHMHMHGDPYRTYVSHMLRHCLQGKDLSLERAVEIEAVCGFAEPNESVQCPSR